MNPIIKKLSKFDKYLEYISDVNANIFPISLNGLSDAQKAQIIVATQFYTQQPVCVIANNEIAAQTFVKDIKALSNEQVYMCTKRETSIYDYDAQSRQSDIDRAVMLTKLAQSKSNFAIMTIESISQGIVGNISFANCVIHINKANILDLDKLFSELIRNGYERAPMVEVKGQFCVRGGIVDIFPSNLQQPVRIELFDNEVDSIRTFNSINQRSIDTLNEVEIYPATEYIWNSDEKESVVKKIRKKAEKLINLSVKEKEQIEEDIEQISEGKYINKVDKYFSCFFEKENIMKLLPANVLIFVDEPDRVEQRINNISYEMQEIAKDLVEKQKYVPEFLENMIDMCSVERELENRKSIYLQKLEKGYNNINVLNPVKVYSFSCKEVVSFQGLTDIFLNEIKMYYEKENTVVIFMQNKIKAQNLSNLLIENDVENKFYDSIDFIDEFEDNRIYIVIGYTSGSYEYRDMKLVVINDVDDGGEIKKRSRKSIAFKEAKRVVLADLEVNDYIVHVAYGIGQYVGIDTLVVDKISKDYVKLKYKDNDMLYIPTDQLDSIRKYVALNESNPKVNKLGTKEWEKAKAKAKKNVEDIAKELVELYAKRENTKGFAFLPDTQWQLQFEQDFPYQETDDQLRCIKEVKQDMEKDIPMDRLLCGDVGYGKTEVAIRAAFKAVMSGKQVAYLVPTTILANQQYESFNERMKKYGIKVEVLNRFKTKKEQLEIIKKLKLGDVDVVVGTHRILQKDIGFKDLGFLIIDEEHRFGVKDKEKIKQLRSNIDVLSMTATPIPRTLHMSIVGIRDMSVIYDPPQNRKPIQTYVLEYDKYIVQDAIIKELERAGQVFYLYNRVEDIEKKVVEVQKLVPNAKVEFAHGKMSGDEIENIMYDFINKKIDVLVCTTILESGIDIPNVNTMIIENADRMGLAQLYQIRGRVGRKDRQAYAYITYKKDKLLSQDAEKRLKAIKEFTEFGSGFKIALRDLEIRGSGNILGSEQHGHMEAVGYEMYCKMLEEAVKELQGYTTEEDSEITIDINVSAYIPNEYIQEQNQKIEVYQNIAICRTLEDIEDITDEVIDRYGNMPNEVINLFEIAKIKVIARQLGIISIINKKNMVKIEVGAENSINNLKLIQFVDKNRMEMKIENNIVIRKLKSNEQNKVLSVIKEILKEIK